MPKALTLPEREMNVQGNEYPTKINDS